MTSVISGDIEGGKAVNRLNELGYEQELDRSLSFLGILGLGMGLVCLPYTVYAISCIMFTEGGAVDFIYGWGIWGLLTIPIVLSMGEICSVYPIASGTYYWSYALAPLRQKRLGSFINGFLVTVGLILALLATAFPMGQVISTAVVLFHPDYIIPTWLPYVIFLVLLVVTVALCSAGTVFLDLFSRTGGVLIPIVTVVLFIVPLAKGTERHTIRWVLSNFESYSGWNDAASFLIGLLGPGGLLIGFGFLTSLCEEVDNPAVAVPRAMLITQVVGVSTGLIFVFATLFTVPLGLDIASAQLGQAAYVIFDGVMDTKGGAFVLLILSTAMGFFLLTGTMTAASRFLWAFARDGGLPGSKWLSVVHPRLKIPLNSMITVAVVDALLGLISFGSSVAYGAFLSGCTIMLLFAYAQPIIYVIMDRRRSMKDAQWSLGRWGWPINIVAVLVAILGSVLFLFPLSRPVTVLTMNWSVVLVAGFLAIGLFYYAVYGRKVFRAPAVADNENAIPDTGSRESKEEGFSTKVLPAEDIED
ncbi:choline transport protein, partial [Phenoliferia sp. Uapishka_3]